MDDWTYGGFGIYIHWPFCAAKCPYCDFNSHVSKKVEQKQWLKRYLSEIQREGQLTTGHARALITSDDQVDLARQVVKKGLSVRETERLVKRAAQADGPKDKPKPKARNLVEKDADTRALEADLSVGLGMKVLVSHVDGTETGTISITYGDLDQLDDLCRILSSTQQVESK